jgi:hypothetical protein
LKALLFHEARIMAKDEAKRRPAAAAGKDMQPGTGSKGKNWQSPRPDPDDPDDKLERALEDSFPASDPPQPAQPGVTGWDLDDEPVKKADAKKKL